MKARTVKKGKRNFKPEHKRQPKLRLGNKKIRKFRLDFKLPKQAWFKPEDFEKFSILKLGGITFFRFNSIRPNQDALLVGYKPAPDGKFYVYAYVNYTDKSWIHGEPIVVAPDIGYYVIAEEINGVILYSFFTEQNVLITQQKFTNEENPGENTYNLNNKPIKFKGLMYNVSPYHGGSSEESKAQMDTTIFTEIDSE